MNKLIALVALIISALGFYLVSLIYLIFGVIWRVLAIGVLIAPIWLIVWLIVR